MVSDRWLKVGAVFGVVACVVLAIACGGGGGGGGGGPSGGPDLVAMGVNIAYPSAAAKPAAKPDQPVDEEGRLRGTVFLQDVHTGNEYAAVFEPGSYAKVGGVDTFGFTTDVPAGLTLLVVASRILDEDLGIGGWTMERGECIVPSSEEGDLSVNSETTQASAIVQKQTANTLIGGDPAELYQITREAITTAVADANAIVAETYLDSFDFSTKTQEEIVDIIVDYAIMLAVAAVMDGYRATWEADNPAFTDFSSNGWNVATVAEVDVAIDVTTVLNDNTSVPDGVDLAVVEGEVAATVVDATLVADAGEFGSGDFEIVNTALEYYIAALDALSSGDANLTYSKLKSARTDSSFSSASTDVQGKIKFLYALTRLPGMFLISHAGGASAPAEADYSSRNKLPGLINYHLGIKEIDVHLYNNADAVIGDVEIDDDLGLDLTLEAGSTNGEVYWDEDDGLEWDYTVAYQDQIDQRGPSSPKIRQAVGDITAAEVAAILTDLATLPSDFYYELTPSMQGDASTHTIQFDYVDVYGIRIYYTALKFGLDYAIAWDADFDDPDDWSISEGWYPDTSSYNNVHSLDMLFDAAELEGDPDAAEDAIYEGLYENNPSFATGSSTKLATAKATLKSVITLMKTLESELKAIHNSTDTDVTERGIYLQEDLLGDDIDWRKFHLVVNYDCYLREFNDDVAALSGGAQDAEIDSRWTDIVNGVGRATEFSSSLDAATTIQFSQVGSEGQDEKMNLSVAFGVDVLRDAMYDGSALVQTPDGSNDVLNDIFPLVNYHIDDTEWQDSNGYYFDVCQLGQEIEFEFWSLWMEGDARITGGNDFTMTFEYNCFGTPTTATLTATINSATSMSGTVTGGCACCFPSGAWSATLQP